MKKLLALLLALVMSLSLAACGGSGEETPSDTTDEGSGTEETAGIAAEDLQIGLICIHDENSGYDLAHIDGLRGACEALGIGEDQLRVAAKSAVCKIAMLPEPLVRKYYDAGLLEIEDWEWTITPSAGSRRGSNRVRRSPSAPRWSSSAEKKSWPAIDRQVVSDAPSRATQ